MNWTFDKSRLGQIGKRLEWLNNKIDGIHNRLDALATYLETDNLDALQSAINNRTIGHPGHTDNAHTHNLRIGIWSNNQLLSVNVRQCQNRSGISIFPQGTIPFANVGEIRIELLD